jgi:hypothetical protein
MGTWWGRSTMVGAGLPLVLLPHLLVVSSLGGFIHNLHRDVWSVLWLAIFVGSSCEELAMFDVLLLGIQSCLPMRSLA